MELRSQSILYQVFIALFCTLNSLFNVNRDPLLQDILFFPNDFHCRMSKASQMSKTYWKTYCRLTFDICLSFTSGTYSRKNKQVFTLSYILKCWFINYYSNYSICLITVQSILTTLRAAFYDFPVITIYFSSHSLVLTVD